MCMGQLNENTNKLAEAERCWGLGTISKAEAGFLGNFVPPSAAKRGFNLDGEALRAQTEVEKLSKSVSYGRFVRSLLRRWKLLKILMRPWEEGVDGEERTMTTILKEHSVWEKGSGDL
ncbi:hypothetical protein B296_00011359 [Ensete ventricosum]|uniref:Uncharacterized protein n=1 Tax=Ensete ventricosum TaxID=4639 RepID=A0A427B3G8_ENSVE|nr:hypothetical protein B296_00011359 [Ensete ventricosum]